MADEVKKASFLACSCLHVPFNPPETVDWLLGRLSDLQPDVFVFLGDLFDSSAVSVHPHEYEHSLELEYEEGADIFSRVMKAIPNSKYVWCLGNHDANIRSEDPRRSPKQLRSLFDRNNHFVYGKVFRKFKQIPYIKDGRGVYRLGQVGFFHGWDAGVNSDELESLQMANLTGGQAWRLFVRGHTHRPTRVTQCLRTKKIPLPWFYANAGTLGPLKPPYTHRKDTFNWGAGLVIGETSLSSPRRPSASEWDAHTEFFK